MNCFDLLSHLLSGYTSSFLRDSKSEDSYLAACLSDQVPGDDTPPKDDNSDVPLSDLGEKVPAKKKHTGRED